MLKTLRIAFMWLLAFAVPVQGFAATTMLFCMGDVHHAARAHAVVAQPHEPGHVQGHEQGHPHDDHPAMADHHGEHHGDHAVAADGHDDSSTHKTAGKCSACSACCLAIAMPTSVAKLDTLQSADALVAWEHPSRPVFLTDGPERPPRTILA